MIKHGMNKRTVSDPAAYTASEAQRNMCSFSGVMSGICKKVATTEGVRSPAALEAEDQTRQVKSVVFERLT